MIKFRKINTACYAIGKRIQGYHLLKNPKGMAQTEIHMIKNKHDGVSTSGVRATIICRISRRIDSLGNIITSEKTVISNRIYDFENKKFSKAENISLWISGNNRYTNKFERENYTFEQLDKFPQRPWTKETNEMINRMNEPKEEVRLKRENFFKVLYHNLTNKA